MLENQHATRKKTFHYTFSIVTGIEIYQAENTSESTGFLSKGLYP